jgi:hypothetical protein
VLVVVVVELTLLLRLMEVQMEFLKVVTVELLHIQQVAVLLAVVVMALTTYTRLALLASLLVAAAAQ